jgi:uncharacterized protein (TIGR01655 family)
MKKKIVILAAVLLVIAGAFCAKGYYNDRYVVSDCYYTQVPKDEVNEDSWLVDEDGARQAEGKSYELMGYNEQGEQREVYFTKSGSAEDYYAPGTYIKVSMSKTIALGVEVVEEQSVPQLALDKIQELGTKVD